MPPTRRPDYGIDAPHVVRNLAIAGGLLLSAATLTIMGILPRVIALGSGLRIGLLGMWLGAGGGLTAAAFWMLWGSRVGKIKERERLLDHIAWRGDERVLDVGCGRGLVLVGAAKRLKTGAAVGIDLWQKEDLSGNRPEAPLRNATLEGVFSRVSVQTADMRKLPFPDGAFQIVVSRAAIHNLYAENDRALAIAEIARVLGPGGRALISDIRHLDQYARAFGQAGLRDVRLLDSKVISALTSVLTLGSLHPNTVLATKDASLASGAR